MPVCLTPCEDYSLPRLREVLRASVEAMGGWSPYIQPGEKVLLKVNLVSNIDPDHAATTHPNFVQVLAELLLEYGAKVIIGDSPGGLFNEEILKRNYKGTGMAMAAENSGAQLSYNTGSVEITNPQAKLLKNMTQTAMVSDADKVISVSKLKTHGMMTFTGAVKNQFGTVPGTRKAEYHFRMPKVEDFADALIDICLAAHPVLSFMDGIMAMEGNGPTGGTPVQMGVVLASPDPFQLDLVASGLIGLSRDDVPTLKQGYLRGLCPEKTEDVKVVNALEYPLPEGMDQAAYLESLTKRDFKMPDHINPKLMRKLGFLGDFLSDHLRPKVRIHSDLCVGCRTCFNHCPAKAMTMVERPEKEQKAGKKTLIPKVDHHVCIRCFCCQELCPKVAITIHESVIMNLANKL